MQGLINTCGWRQALVVTGIGMWIVGIPLSLVLKHRPEQYGLLPDGDIPNPQESLPSSPGTEDNPVKESKGPVDSKDVNTEINFTVLQALQTRTFWLLSVGASLSFMAMSAVFVHVMPYLESVGINRDRAGLAVTPGGHPEATGGRVRHLVGSAPRGRSERPLRPQPAGRRQARGAVAEGARQARGSGGEASSAPSAPPT